MSETPRTMVFGDLTVREDLSRDLLTPKEREIYDHGLTTLRLLVFASSEVERFILTSPMIVSTITGLQPHLSLSGREGALITRLAREKIPSFLNRYSFFEALPTSILVARSREIMINNEAAESAVRQNQDLLGLDLPDNPLTQNDISRLVLEHLGRPDEKKVGLLVGVLSGFPKGDIREDSRDLLDRVLLPRPLIVTKTYSTEISYDQALAKLDTYRGGWGSAYTGAALHWPPEKNPTHLTIAGFGLAWGTSNPASEAAVMHCQKIMQVDRELGLLDFVDRERSQIDNERVMAEIGKAKRREFFRQILNLGKKIFKKSPET